jgi:CRP-like cAMP-binding protein
MAELPSALLARIEALCQWQRLPPESFLINFQDRTNDVFIVAKGQVRAAVYSKGGVRVAFRTLGEGEMFGELAAIDGEPRSACIETLETSTVGRLAHADFWTLLDEEREFRRLVLVRMTRLVRSLSERIVEYSVLTVPCRVHALVLRLALEQPSQSAGTAYIAQPPSQSELATMISTTREAISRELGRLREAGILEKQGGGWLIKDLRGLVELVRKESEEG